MNYDPRYNIAYLKLQDKTENVESIRISDEFIVDISPDGRIYGIEFLNANEQLKSGGIESFIMKNDETGKCAEYTLP